MIELTKFNDSKITVNAEIIESIEETPDTVITLTTGKKLVDNFFVSAKELTVFVLTLTVKSIIVKENKRHQLKI